MSGKTEWEDALIRHGIIDAPPKEVTADERALEQYEEHLDSEGRPVDLSDRTMAQLDELEDDVDDDTLDSYRRKRLQQLKAEQAANKFGVYRQIGQTDYKREVTDAEKDVFVVLHLYVDGKPECRLLHQLFEQVSPKFKYVKFRSIISIDANPNFPDSRCPTVLVYRNGDIVRQWVGLSMFGGVKANAACVEWVLSSIGAVRSSLEEDPRKSLQVMSMQRKGLIIDSMGSSRASASRRIVSSSSESSSATQYSASGIQYADDDSDDDDDW